MGFQLKLLGFWTLLLSALIFGHSHKVTVNVAGNINCRGCIKHELTTSPEHSGLRVTVHCDFQSRERKTHGTSSVDKEGRFNVTLSAEIMEDKYSKHRCYATLKSALATQCPIHKDGTASVKNISFHHSATQTLHYIHNPIAFSPVTCQSAFLWPFFKFPPTPEFMLPYPSPPTAYTPSAPPAQLPFPPRIPNSPMIPSLPPPGSENGNPIFPPPTSTARIPNIPPLPPTLPPSGQECGNLFPPPKMPTFIPPKVPIPSPAPKFRKPPSSKTPVYETPYVPSPPPLLLPPISPPSFTVVAPFPIPDEKLSPPPVQYRETNPIPRPPPLPPMATVVPRKFINPPKP